MDRNSKSKDQQSLWETFLKEAYLDDQFQDSHLVLVGPKNAGKRSLINTILNNIINSRNNNQLMGVKGMASALEYSYLMIKNPEDPENDEFVSKINVWTVDELSLHDLLGICINEETIQKMMICICLDLSEPWNAITQLNQWISVVGDRLSKVLTNIPLKTQDQLRARLRKYVQSYELPQFDEDGKLIVKKLIKKEDTHRGENNEHHEEEEDYDVPLPKDVLTVNYGVPIMIVGTKADTLEVYEKDKDYDYKLDVLQYSLRKYAMAYGASILYTSMKANINIDIFYEYLIHRFYNFGLKYSPEVIHKDSVFIPSGYDNTKILTQTFPTIKDDAYVEDLFPEPPKKNVAGKEEVVIEDYQQFLQKLKEKLPQTTSSRQAHTQEEHADGTSKESTTGGTKPRGEGEEQKSGTQNTSTDPRSYFTELMRSDSRVGTNAGVPVQRRQNQSMTMFEHGGDVASRPVSSVASSRDTNSKVQRLMNLIGK